MNNRGRVRIRAVAMLVGLGCALAADEARSGGTAAPKHDPPAPVVDEARLPSGKVLVEICDGGVPDQEAWPSRSPAATERYEAEAFGFPRVPQVYIDTGVRADRSNPCLLRAAARVVLPAGRHRLLVRGRGASRLYVDGQLVLSLPFPPPINSGHTKIPYTYLDLAADFRFAPPGNREAFTELASPGRAHLVVLETIVGGGKGKATLRPELGETVVAISPEGTESFQLLAPGRVVPYTDAGWRVYAAEAEQAICRLEAERRAEAWAHHQAEWDARRAHARQWLSAHPGPAVPPPPAGSAATGPIDRFLAAAHPAEAERKGDQGRETIDFATEVRPILEARCFSCHQGPKVRGKLRLDSRAAALAGGASGEPAIVPGRPGEGELIARVTSDDDSERMPPKGDPLRAEEVDRLRRWVAEGASWSPRRAHEATPPADDLAFLRRITLDTVGLIPTEDEVRAYLADPGPDRRARAIDRLLDDPRWADQWVGYWQDVLAENPNILNPTLNNTGPFRWWIYESMLDNKPVDVFVTELLRMRGSLYQGGPAGFAMASQNDVPMAEKGVIVAAAFLGMSMKCARCHDAPAHRSTQKDLFQLAALLTEKPVAVPKTSSVPLDRLHGKGRPPLIQVTLKPGTKVEPGWPFPELAAPEVASALVPEDASPRDRLAALITAPENERFAQVIANRVWARLMGRPLVDPPDDWEKATPSHPELLQYLGRELVRGNYDLKHLVRLIVRSDAYQRASAADLTEADPLFAARARRRMSAEQLLDSLFQASGKTLETEEVNLDIDGGRDIRSSISLGRPRRAWQFASTSNERDRPSLSLPRVQAVIDVLQAFGWRASRQDPVTVRETDSNLLQPAILANGPVGVWLTRLSDDHGTTRLALEDQPVEALVDRLFLRVLTRPPRPEERAAVTEYLAPGYAGRVVEHPPASTETGPRRPPRYVSWSNHLTEEANAIKIEREAEARRGDPPTGRLEPDWRKRMEDVLWALLNDPEFLFIP